MEHCARPEQEAFTNLVSRSKIDVQGFDDANLGTISNQTYFKVDLDNERRQTKGAERTEDDNPLLVIIPISKNSAPKKASAASDAKTVGGTTRVSLEAAEHILGIGISFPPAKFPTPQKYVTVDPSKLPYYDEEEFYEDDEELDGGGAS